MKSPITFEEEYEVSLDYPRSDGFWVCSHRVHFSHRVRIRVTVPHGVNEKKNHEAAAELARQQYPGCRINGITYC